MFRYIAVVWNWREERDVGAAARIRQRLLSRFSTWARALERPGLLVLCDVREGLAGHTVIRVGERGAVLGTLFRRGRSGDVAKVAELDAVEIRDAERSRGRSLVETHWGSYVLFLSGDESGNTCVLRGPLSLLPCYHTVHENVSLFFSMADDCISLNLIRFSINWTRVRAQVATADYLNGETGVNELRAIETGTCLSVCGSKRTIEVYWTPAAARCDTEVKDFAAAARALRRLTRTCLASWADAHDSILIKLSGGLDSSIVLACLARAPDRPRLACVNFYSALLGDERVFARSMTQRVGAELIERERNANLDLRVVLQCNRTPSPVLHLTGFDSEPVTARLARDLHATTIFNGELGDDLFGSAVREEVLVEYVRRYGLCPSLVRVAVDYGLRRRISVWRGLRLAFRHRDLRHGSWSAERYAREVSRGSPESRLASVAALEASEATTDRFVHPWSKEAVPAGKRQLVHALQVVTSTSYESPFGAVDDPPIVSPFVSQPLVELALAIPTHLHIRGGENRALARAAFSGDLSLPVLQRGSGKGSPDLWLRALVDHNRAFLRALLLDGVLVGEKLLDRGKVEQALSDRMCKSTAVLPDIIAQMYIEAWLRRWSEVERCAAA